MSPPTAIVPCSANLDGLERLLGSIREGGCDCEIIVADNDSPGRGASAIAAEHAARALTFEHNLGYGRAVNRAAAEAGPGPLVLINDDCILEPGYIEAITAPLDRDRGVVMVAGALREGADEARIDTAGIELDRTLLAFDYLNGEPVGALATAPAPLGPSAAAAAIDRDAFDAVAGFDEHLFAYWEDVDLMLRLRLAGGRCDLSREVLGTHAHSATLGPGSPEKARMMGFGRGYVLRKWGVMSRGRAPGAVVRELGILAGQGLTDRTLAGLPARVAGWRSAEPGPYPAEAVAGARASGLIVTMRRRYARRRRVRGPRRSGPRRG